MGERPIKAPQEVVTESPFGITRMTIEDGNWSFGTPNYYLIQGSNAAVVVDSGTGSLAEYNLFEKTWVSKGRPTVSAVIVSHHHFDHKGGSSDFAELVGASVIGGSEEQEEERVLDLGEREVVVLPTPGHTRDSLCVLDKKTNALLTGDTIIEDKSVVVSDMGDYVRTLEELKRLAPSVIFPGHGSEISDGLHKIEAYIAQTHRRERKIVGFINHGLNSIDGLVRRMYPQNRHMGEIQVKAHIEKLIKDGRLKENEGQLEMI